MTKTSFFLKSGLTAGLLSLGLAGCGDTNTNDAEGNGDTVTIGYQTGNTLNVLMETGYLDERLEEEGYDVEWIEFEVGSALMEALASGNIDYGNAADGPGIFAQASGHDIVYTGGSVPHEEGVGIMVQEDSDIDSVSDLEGRSIAATEGGNHFYLAVLALEEAGLSFDDVDFTYVNDASQGQAALESNEVDALASWDPFFAAVEENLNVRTLDHDVTDYPNRTFYFATNEFAEESPEVVQMILEETNRSDQWANENPEDVSELLAGMVGMDESVMERAIDRRTFGVENIDEDIIDAQQQQADVYYEIDLIEDEIDVSEVMPTDAPWTSDNLE
ncbi:aliphatic sulfonate ABC transporter substrate-binding protein [Salicibibacter cibi]|uniref:aliphatic sulfonate ABC transporter substrate-binding protein n=1 Tax=Salicibibacter cibi TaxID=2743001 RepID=UPI001FE863A9|nr:aliphatic sulfonate ABC transporter substrate-binding protein [Salicibibacter cibi]